MTLAANIQEQINEVIAEFIREGKMFTAFEVSLAVKQRGIHERHRNMREFVHETIFRLGIERGDYSRTLMDVGAPEQAWVYHTVGTNPYDYVPLDRTGMETVPQSARPRGVRNPTRLSAMSSPFAIPPGAYGTDQRGRLCVPVNLLDGLGVGPGERVNVLCDPANEQALLTKATANDPGHPDTSYTVEPDGNVRMTQGTLEKAGLDGLQCYKIEGNDTVISVRKFS
jgi:hypothetical protein